MVPDIFTSTDEQKYHLKICTNTLADFCRYCVLENTLIDNSTRGLVLNYVLISGYTLHTIRKIEIVHSQSKKG